MPMINLPISGCTQIGCGQSARAATEVRRSGFGAVVEPGPIFPQNAQKNAEKDHKAGA